MGERRDELGSDFDPTRHRSHCGLSYEKLGLFRLRPPSGRTSFMTACGAHKLPPKSQHGPLMRIASTRIS
jgi:hypothetical protein